MANPSGPFGALRNIATTLLATLQTRLALVGNELETAKRLLFAQLALGLALVFCLGVGLLLAIGLAVHVWWEQRVWVLAASAVIFWGLAGYCYAALRRSLGTSDDLFAASLTELQHDLHQLRAAAAHSADHGPDVQPGRGAGHG